MLFPNARILVFAKPPIPGHCKTRLIPALGKEGAADLHDQLVHHTLKNTTGADLCPVELWMAGDLNHPSVQNWAEQYPIALKQQSGADLGQRMANAFRETLLNAPYAILVGTDCPTLSKADFTQGLEALAEGKRVVLSPANDGGYVLIGLSTISEELFANIPWGTSNVFDETIARIGKLNWPYNILPRHHDIDRPEDLAQLKLEEITIRKKSLIESALHIKE